MYGLNFELSSPLSKGEIIMLLEPQGLLSKIDVFFSQDGSGCKDFGWKYKLNGDDESSMFEVRKAISELEVSNQLSIKNSYGDVLSYLHIRFGYPDEKYNRFLQHHPFVDISINGNLGGFGKSKNLISVVIETSSQWQSSSSFYIPILAYIFKCFNPVFAFSADSDAIYNCVIDNDTFGGADPSELRQYPWNFYWSSMLFNTDKIDSLKSSRLTSVPVYSSIALTDSLIWIMDTSKIGIERPFVYELCETDGSKSRFQDESLKRLILDQQEKHETVIKDHLNLSLRPF